MWKLSPQKQYFSHAMLRKSGCNGNSRLVSDRRGCSVRAMTSCEDWRSRKEAKEKVKIKSTKPSLNFSPAAASPSLGPSQAICNSVTMNVKKKCLMSRNVDANGFARTTIRDVSRT